MARERDQGREDRREIDWGTAQVAQGELRVELTGQTSGEWSERLEAVLSRLRGGNRRWGEITVTKKQLRVASVQEGAEADLRHLLEGAVQQVNADLAPPEPAKGDEGEDGGSAPDRQMTEAFRAFGEPESPAPEADGAK